MKSLILKQLFILCAALACCSAATTLQAQDEGLFGAPAKVRTEGIIIGINAGIDAPAADMAKRFGHSFRLGPSVLYRTGDYYFGLKGDYIFGDKIKEDALLSNIRNADGSFTSSDGYGVGIGVFLRGYAVGLLAGRQLSFGSAGNGEQSVLVLAGAGFMQHKISLVDQDNHVPMLAGDYEKGYDRLTNGAYTSLQVSYQRFGKNGLLNFYIGPDVLAGFTRGRRDWWYDVNKPGNDKRLDLLFGLRGGLYIPIYKRRSDDVYFE